MISMIRKFIALLLPDRLKEKLRHKLKIFRNYRYDYQRFMKWSSSERKFASQSQMKALIVKEYHRVEKALTLPSPRVPFGLVLVKDLISLLKDYIHQYSSDQVVITAVAVLAEYFKFHKDHGFEDPVMIKNFEELKKNVPFDVENYSLGGSLDLTRNEILTRSKVDLKNFFDSRFSIRHFSDEDVEIQTIEKAVLMARKTPSVCNRQSSRVHVYSNKKDISELLEYQNGNAGFRDEVNKLLIITSDLQNFLNVGERYQCWIDGGMFAMSVVYALHSLGVGTCCLNWSVEFDLDKVLRSKAKILDSETIIMLIAVGYLPDKFKVARSVRKDIKEYLIEHK